VNSKRNIGDLGSPYVSEQPATQAKDPPLGRLSNLNLPSLSQGRVRQIGFSIADQTFSVGAIFLINIALARTQAQQSYGIFALTYTIFTFLSGLHNAAILEAYTIYGSGRYHHKFAAYERLLWRTNAFVSLAVTVVLTLVWGALAWIAPARASYTLLGMALSCGIFLTASFVRRTFYMRRRPELAAKFSTIFFITSIVLLGLSMRAHILSGFYAFMIAASAWCVAALFVMRTSPGDEKREDFAATEPSYWSEHWKYSRWVFVTALVFQFTTQGYYWLTAGLLSVKEVADLRAMSNLVVPMDQVFGAMNLLILPMLSLRFASRRMAGLIPLWQKYCLAWLLVSAGFAVALNFVGKPLMHRLYAGKFDHIASLVGLLALLPIVMGTGNTINAALKALEKPKAVFYAYVTSGATTFLLGIPLVIRFGLHGAVYGTLASAAAYSAALAVAFLTCFRAERRNILSTAVAKGNFVP
jgi:O-antigen/teichoic acid export membrane protein